MGFCMVSLCAFRHISSQCSGWALKRRWKSTLLITGPLKTYIHTRLSSSRPALAIPWNLAVAAPDNNDFVTPTEILLSPVFAGLSKFQRHVLIFLNFRNWVFWFMLHQRLCTWMLGRNFACECEIGTKLWKNLIITAIIRTRTVKYKTIISFITGTNVQVQVSFC